LCPAKQLPLSNKDKEERVSSLTPREKDVFRLLLAGLMLKETAKELGIKYSTANSHMSAVYRKLNVNTRAELIINYGGIGR
jgi:DNA-binding CsgD family transcriptional regulator